MGLIHVVMTLLVVGILLWVVERAPFVSTAIKPIIRWVVLAAVVIWLVTIFFGDVPLPRFGR